MKSKFILIHHLFSLFLFVNFTFADDNFGSPGAFLRFGVGTRALALGNAFTAIADDATAVYWNPAGLIQMRNIQLNVQYSHLPFDRTFHFIGSVLPLRRIGSFGFSWIGYKVNNLEARQTNTLKPDYFFSNSENALMISFGRQINSRLSMGGNFKWIYHSLDNRTASGYGFDAAILVTLIQNLKMGIMIQDINTQKKWDNGFTDLFQQTIRIGASYHLAPYLLFSGEIENRWNEKPVRHFGVEIKSFNNLSVQIGMNKNRFTSGASLNIPLSNIDLKLGYGLTNSEIGDFYIHGFSLNLSFHRASSKSFPGMTTIESKNSVKRFEILANLLYVRDGPGMQHPVIDSVRKGEQFESRTQLRGWLKIRLRSGKTGWISGKYTRVIR